VDFAAGCAFRARNDESNESKRRENIFSLVDLSFRARKIQEVAIALCNRAKSEIISTPVQS
jgi:hypothetical protein